MRLMVVIFTCAVLFSGCASGQLEPYDGRRFCDLAGGVYTSDGRCLAGHL